MIGLATDCQINDRLAAETRHVGGDDQPAAHYGSQAGALYPKAS